MNNDSETKILTDWNALKQTPFDSFDELFKYLKQATREHGMQNKKELHKDNLLYSPLDAAFSRNLAESKKLQAWTKKVFKQSSTNTVTFRRRVKALKKTKRT